MGFGVKNHHPILNIVEMLSGYSDICICLAFRGDVWKERGIWKSPVRIKILKTMGVGKVAKRTTIEERKRWVQDQALRMPII